MNDKAVTRIHVEGFRSLKKVDLSPGRVTILIGPNGSGKSNFLSVLRMVPLMRTQSLRRFVSDAGGAASLLHYGPKVTQEISLRLELAQGATASAYSARLGHTGGDQLAFREETVEHRPEGSGEFQPAQALGTGHAESLLEQAALSNTTARTVRGWLQGMSFFHFHDTSKEAPLRQASRQEDTEYLRSDGSNLAAYLHALHMSEDHEGAAAWRRINQLVRRVAPFIKRLQPALLSPTAPLVSAVRLDWVDERDETFGCHQLSDGTLRCIALFTALAQPTARLPAFIAIDEPELGLHPAALSIFASLVRSASAHAQIVLATQAPALLDEFDEGDVVVCERREAATTFDRLEREKLKAWREEYSLSELYAKNVLGGRP